MAVYFPESNIMYIHFPKTGGCTFYSMIQTLGINHETVGFQHDPIDHLGKHFFTNKPKVIIFSRDKESWFKSYHRWRNKNTINDYLLPGVNELWHPKWVLEDLFHREYETFRKRVEEKHPRYYENLCEIYYNHPTFDLTIYRYELFVDSYYEVLKRIGHKVTKEFIGNYPKINATRVFSSVN